MIITNQTNSINSFVINSNKLSSKLISIILKVVVSPNNINTNVYFISINKAS